jgi:hypothetical protein
MARATGGKGAGMQPHAIENADFFAPRPIRLRPAAVTIA